VTPDEPEPLDEPAAPYGRDPESAESMPGGDRPGTATSDHGPPGPSPPARSRALAEVLLCSGYPTQLAIAGVLQTSGIPALTPSRGFSAPFVFVVSIADTVLLVSIIFLLLRREGVRPREVLIGRRPAWREALLGLWLAPVVLIVVGAVMLTLRTVAPSLHNVPENPLTSMLLTRWGLAASIAVVVLAGGLREEVQRAFLLRRFEQRLGGRAAGVIATSLGFGLGHTLQGWDAAIVTGLLGAGWAVLILARGGIPAAVACHSAFNVIELLIAGSTMGPLE
jgi:membrane protease YdiL (CAAX protease family)